MKNLLLTLIFISLLTACTLRKEGGTWAVKRTIVDDVKDTVEGTKELVTDLKDANEDLENKNNKQTSPAETEKTTTDASKPSYGR